MTSTAFLPGDHSDQRLPEFNTERFIVAPLAPPEVKELAQALLHERLAREVRWLPDQGADGGAKEAFLLKMQGAARTVSAWGIVERTRSMLVGAVLARHTRGGMDVEVLCASAFRGQGVPDEVAAPVAAWLEDQARAEMVLRTD